MGKEYVERLPAAEPVGDCDPGPRSLIPDPFAVDFLLRCLSVSRQRLAVSRRPTRDWNAVTTVAAEHGLTPLLYTRLKQNDAHVYVPPDVRERMRRVYVVSAVRSISLQGELRTVLQRLRDSGIPVIVLKGAYLAEGVYGDAALRPMVDVDLLVREADLGRAQAVLLDMNGYHRQPEDADSSRTRRAHLPAIHIGQLTVEVHWTIVSPIGPVRADVAGLWNRAAPCSIAGVEVLALSPEDLLLHLCLHACYQHLLMSLLCLTDIAETVQRFGGRMDWDGFAARASAWGASRYVGLALHLARTMLDAQVPAEALERLVPGGIDRRMLEAARESVLTRTGYGQWLPLFDREHVTGFNDRVKLAWTRVFLSRAEMGAMYPGSRNARCLWRYYARQVARVVALYTTHTLRRARLMRSRERDRYAALVNWLSERS